MSFPNAALPPEVIDGADRIAQLLGETEPRAVHLIRITLLVFGAAQVEAWAQMALERHAQGTEYTDTGVPRTVGGIFFRLVRSHATWPQRRRIFAQEWRT